MGREKGKVDVRKEGLRQWEEEDEGKVDKE